MVSLEWPRPWQVASCSIFTVGDTWPKSFNKRRQGIFGQGTRLVWPRYLAPSVGGIRQVVLPGSTLNATFINDLKLIHFIECFVLYKKKQLNIMVVSSHSESEVVGPLSELKPVEPYSVGLVLIPHCQLLWEEGGFLAVYGKTLGLFINIFFKPSLWLLLIAHSIEQKCMLFYLFIWSYILFCLFWPIYLFTNFTSFH